MYSSVASSTQKLDVEEMRNLINSYRLDNDLEPLNVDPRLLAEADRHANDMAANDEVGHNVSNRGDFSERMESAGFGAVKKVENVGAGYHTIAQAFSGWRGSESHNANMLMPEARSMGVAAKYVPGSKYKVFWVLIVAEEPTS